MNELDEAAIRREKRHRRFVKRLVRRSCAVILWLGGLVGIMQAHPESLPLYIICTVLYLVWSNLARSAKPKHAIDDDTTSVEPTKTSGDLSRHSPSSRLRSVADNSAESGSLLAKIANQKCFLAKSSLIYDQSFRTKLQKLNFKSSQPCPCGSGVRFGVCCAGLQIELRRVLGKGD